MIGDSEPEAGTTFRPCVVCGRPVECEPGYPVGVKVACWHCIDSSLTRDSERLVQSLRELIAALEEPPALGPAEETLLANLRETLEEWEAGE
jgi:hypothetical protein